MKELGEAAGGGLVAGIIAARGATTPDAKEAEALQVSEQAVAATGRWWR